MMRVGVLWERTTPEHLTSETESGSLGIPTPRVTNHQKNSGDKYVSLGAWVKMWPTPDAPAMNLNADPVKHMERLARLKEKHNNGNGAGLTLGVAVKMWPTPTTNDSVGAGYQRANGNHYFTLPGAVGATKHLPPEMEEKRMMTWPTPDAHMGSGGRTSAAPPTGKRASGTKQQITINDAVKWNPETPDSGGQLNPTWVEWLMGWPLGWTDCAASAMAKFQPWCHSHGISCPPNPLRTEN
jgi:hypothetical protein